MSIHDRDPNKIMFAGDWHGVLPQAVRVLDRAQLQDIDTVIQLGDFGIWNDNESGNRYLKGLNNQAKRRGINIYFVDGNHEDFNHLLRYPIIEDGTRQVRSNIFHLPRGFRFNWGGVRYVALGGAYSVDKPSRKEGVSWWPEEWVTDDEIQQVIQGGEADVLLMHDSPAGAPNPVVDDPNSMGAFYFGQVQIDISNYHRERLRPVAEAVDPVFIFHGHYHKFQTANYYQPSGTRTTVISLDEGGATASKHMMTTTREALLEGIENGRSQDNT